MLDSKEQLMDQAQSSCSESDNNLCAGDRERGQAAEAACQGLAVPGALPGNERTCTQKPEIPQQLLRAADAQEIQPP